MDLDLAFRVYEPPKPTEFSTVDQKTNYKKWERSNRMSLMIMKHSISCWVCRLKAMCFLLYMAQSSVLINNKDLIPPNTVFGMFIYNSLL